MYFEDVDFSIRVRKKYEIAFTPKSAPCHKSGAGRGWLVHSPLYQYYYTRNRLWFFSRFGLLYRSYVLIFSFLVVAAKSLNLWINREKVNDLPSSAGASWKGLTDGCVLLFGAELPQDDRAFRMLKHS
jgi:GT2 family glycosyltransferase